MHHWVYIIVYIHHCIYCIYYSINLTLKLLVENRNIIIVFCLIHITSNRITKIMLSGKLLNREFATIVTATIGQALLVKREFARLFVQQEYISMKAGTLRRSRANVLGKNFSLGYIRSRYVSYQPMMPFAKFGVLSAWSIRIYVLRRTKCM